MKGMLAMALAASAMLVGVTAADAREGCGPGGHRGPYGQCRPNRGGPRGPVVVTPSGRVIGRYYNGRGYWDGNRYWRNRYRYHNGWRYR